MCVCMCLQKTMGPVASWPRRRSPTTCLYHAPSRACLTDRPPMSRASKPTSAGSHPWRNSVGPSSLLSCKSSFPARRPYMTPTLHVVSWPDWLSSSELFELWKAFARSEKDVLQSGKSPYVCATPWSFSGWRGWLRIRSDPSLNQRSHLIKLWLIDIPCFPYFHLKATIYFETSK